MTIPFWHPGNPVAWRSCPQGHIGYVMPVTVVVDTPAVTVLFQAPGSICKRRSGTRGGPGNRNLLVEHWDGKHEDRVWNGSPNLRLHVWGTAHSIIRRWNMTTQSAQGWYINLEAAWRRTSIGFDTQDLVLDVTVTDDLSSWAWKDEDELAWSVSVGKYLLQEAEQIRDEGLRVIQALEARAWPFDEDWSKWCPDPNWQVPTLPDNWADSSL